MSNLNISSEESYDLAQVIVNHVKKSIILSPANDVIKILKKEKKKRIKLFKNISLKKAFNYRDLKKLGKMKIKDILVKNISHRYRNGSNANAVKYLMKEYPSFYMFLNSTFKEVYKNFFLNGEYPFFDINPDVDMETIGWINSKDISQNLLWKYDHPKVFLDFARNVFLSKLG